MKEWDPDSTLSMLADERALSGDDDLAASERIFAEHAIPAALSISHMAIHSPNERIRLEAAKYVVDRNLGRIGDSDPLKKAANDPLMNFLKNVSIASSGSN